MATLNFSTESKNSLALAFEELIDKDKKAAYLKIYSNVMPASPSILSNEEYLLGKVDFEYPCAGTPIDGVIQFRFAKVNIAAANGKAVWARIYTNSGKPVLDIDISDRNSSNPGILVLNDTNIKKDGAILINKMVFMTG